MVELNREFLDKKYGKEDLINEFLIDIKRNQIRKIDSNTFKELTNLNTLWLHDNEIEQIDVRLFESLTNLKELWLNNNKLKEIDANTFKELTKLQRLDLDNNEIEKIDLRLFESLSNLKELWMNNNKLKEINANTFKALTKLDLLVLGNNKIEEIDVRVFESLLNLKQLWLNNNKLKRIDSNTFKYLTKLECLSFSDNEIEEIDLRLFESLSNLERLYLSNNKVKEIDRKCFEPLKSIEVIEIYENKGLNALSFIKSSADRIWYLEDKIEKFGSISEWDTFLQQFPYSSSSNLSATKKEIANEFQDPNIGLFLNDRYKINKKLGEGASGLVYLVKDTKTDIRNVKKKAMKIMKQMDSAVNEIELYTEINHENIVRYFDHFHMRMGDEDKTFLITEYCENGDLRKKIKETKRLDKNFEERQILDWIRQSTNALNYLHANKPDAIIHRDIKPENMLLSGKNEIKLGDLGISKLMEDTHVSTYAGTPPYMSPEVFKAQFMEIKYYPNTDVWSLGCVLYELKFLTKAFPRGQFGDPPIPIQVSSSGLFSSILPKMLEKDCLKRITSDKLFTELLNLYDSK